MTLFSAECQDRHGGHGNGRTPSARSTTSLSGSARTDVPRWSFTTANASSPRPSEG